MQDLATITPLPSRSAPKPVKVPKVQGKSKLAIDLMVWEGLTDNQAAVKTGITVVAIRLALKQPHYRAYFRSQCEMLRSRESPRNTHTLIAIRDQKKNQMARVAAIKELERSADQQVSAGQARSPGVVIVIQQGVSQPPPTIDLTHD